MVKINPKKERIKLNDTLNKQLDAMEDTSSLDVFKPKEDVDYNFMKISQEVMEKEEAQVKEEKSSKVWVIPLSVVLLFFVGFVIIKILL